MPGTHTNGQKIESHRLTLNNNHHYEATSTSQVISEGSVEEKDYDDRQVTGEERRRGQVEPGGGERSESS